MAGTLLSAKSLAELDTGLHLDAPVNKTLLNISLYRQSRTGVMRGGRGLMDLPDAA